jgi:hypothetical protein
MSKRTDHAEIVRIVLLSEAQYQSELEKAEAAAEYAYKHYCSAGRIVRSYAPGSPHWAGHGSFTTDLSPNGEQAVWYAKRNKVKLLRSIRDSWQHDGQGTYTIAHPIEACQWHSIEIDTHGVNITDCQNPTEAICKIQMSKKGSVI